MKVGWEIATEALIIESNYCCASQPVSLKYSSIATSIQVRAAFRNPPGHRNHRTSSFIRLEVSSPTFSNHSIRHVHDNQLPFELFEASGTWVDSNQFCAQIVSPSDVSRLRFGRLIFMRPGTICDGHLYARRPYNLLYKRSGRANQI